jgi:hypothetical protein
MSTADWQATAIAEVKNDRRSKRLQKVVEQIVGFDNLN